MKKLFSFLVCMALLSCRNSGTKTSDIIEGEGIVSKNGMVVSAHHESSRVGVEILRKGGNAIDAAVATGFALAVCYPEAGNLGGGGFMVIRTSDGKTDAIDYREKAPVHAFREMFLDRSGEVLKNVSTDTHLATGVPGSVDGMIKAHRKYGRLPFRMVIDPAIRLAEKGFTLSADQAASLNSARKNFLERNHKPTAFAKDNLWKEGDMLIQPELAATLRLIRNKGRDGFYSGKTASLIIKEMERGYGLITEQDLNEYKSLWRLPLTGTYRGFKIITMAPPSGGGVALLQQLGMIENFKVGEMGFHSPEAVHLMVEAERRAFADKAFYLGDPAFVIMPLDNLLNKKYLSDRMKSFSAEKASLSSDIRHGSPEGYSSEETTHYSVVDGMGNAVAVTTTLNGTFGNCVAVEGAGFLLNNEMDDFSVKPGYPNMYGLVGGEANGIRPGKRMLSSMTPTIIVKEGKLFLVLGSPGGSTIPNSVFQVIVNMIDFGMNVQDAVNARRFHHQWLPDYVYYEDNSLDNLAISRLEKIGHTFKRRGAIGRVNAIAVMPDGTMQAGADTRGNNAAAAY